MKRIKLFVTAVLVFVSTLALAQNQVSGVVTDAGTGEALAGAAVQVKGTMTGASAGADGSYSVKVANPQDAVLIFSFFGYKTVEVPAAFRKDAASVVLDLGDVGCAAEVAVNGNVVGMRTCPPWTVDVTDALQDGPNDFAVTVYNTLNNHCQTIPTRYKVTTEKAPSGLLGPMALVVEKRAEQRKITKPLFML